MPIVLLMKDQVKKRLSKIIASNQKEARAGMFGKTETSEQKIGTADRGNGP